jgi:D-alanyl-D-alanine carboxypeptidase (penicillin-binding protein 5/6)
MRARVLLPLALLALVAPARALAAVPPVSARAYVVLNSSTGEVLATKNAHERMPIASITKLMTVLVTLSRTHDLDRIVTVDEPASEVGESTIHLRAGERISVHDLVEGALIQSANDAADELADASGSRAAFVAAMNERARRMGLRDTHFVRPDGLDAPRHFSSAWDVTRLAQVAMHVPFVRQTVRLRTAVISGGRRLYTWNDLLGSFPGVFGVKTGHTAEAGWCEVAAAHEPGTTIYATVLGSPTRSQRNADLVVLLRWALDRYRLARVIDAGRPYAFAAAPYGRAPLALVAPKPARQAVRIGRPLVERVVVPAAVGLPVRAGEPLGSVRVYQGRRLLTSRPLVAARTIARPGAATRIGFYTRHTFKHIWGWVT